MLSAPLDEVQPSASCWGSPGATPGRGWFDSCMHRPTTRRERVRSVPRLHMRSHTCCASAHVHAHRSPPVPSSSLTMILRVPAWPDRVRQVPILRASFWRGLYFAVQIHLRSLSDSDDIGIPCECAGHVCVALQALVVRYLACGMIVMHLNVASIM